MKRIEYIKINNERTKNLYENLLVKYESNLVVKYNDKYSIHLIEITFLMNLMYKINVGALPGGKTEWYIQVNKSNHKENTHFHSFEDEIYKVIDDTYRETSKQLSIRSEYSFEDFKKDIVESALETQFIYKGNLFDLGQVNREARFFNPFSKKYKETPIWRLYNDTDDIEICRSSRETICDEILIDGYRLIEIWDDIVI